MTRVERRRKAIDVERTDGPFAPAQDVAAQWDELRACVECGDVKPDTRSLTCSESCANRHSRRRSRVMRANLRKRGQR